MHRLFYGLAVVVALLGVALVILGVASSASPSAIGPSSSTVLTVGLMLLPAAAICLFAAVVLHRLTDIAETNAELLATVRGDRRE